MNTDFCCKLHINYLLASWWEDFAGYNFFFLLSDISLSKDMFVVLFQLWHFPQSYTKNTEKQNPVKFKTFKVLQEF